MQSSTGWAWMSMMRIDWHILPNTANFQTTVLQGWDLLRAEDVFKRTSRADAHARAHAHAHADEQLAHAEDCADPSIASRDLPAAYDELEAGFC